MTGVEFLELLKKYNINEKRVVFDDTMKEGYCVRKNHFRWEVFFGKYPPKIIFSNTITLFYCVIKHYKIFVNIVFF